MDTSDVDPTLDMEAQIIGRCRGLGRAKGRGWVGGAAPARERARESFFEPEVEYTEKDYYIRGVGKVQVLQVSVNTPVLQGLLIYLLRHLEVILLNVSGIPQTLSGVLPSVPNFAYGTPTLWVQPSFVVPSIY